MRPDRLRSEAPAALLLIAALLVLEGGAGLLIHRRADRRAAARPPITDVADLLRVRTAALGAHDEATFLSLLDPTVPGLLAQQRTEFDDLAAVPLAGARYSQAVPTVGAGTRVVFTYALSGFDVAAQAATETDTFRLSGGHLLLSGVRHDTPVIWADGPLSVARGRRSLVLIAAAAAGQAQQVTTEVDADVATVTAAWGEAWAQRVVVLVPATTAEFGALVGESGDLSQVAAAQSGQRLVLDSPVFAQLSTVGRQVTVTHELTHVASATVTDPSVPRWLVEGLADVVGYSRADLSRAAAVAELAAEVSAGRVPRALPSDAAYAAGSADLAATYEQGYLACLLIADRLGTAGLVGFYRSVGSSGLPPAQALESVLLQQLHETTAAFTARWVAAVRALG